jgi:acetyl esterase/lipase
LPLIYGLASRGWLCISANYRLSPDAQFPDHLIDVKKVVAWVRTDAADYGADPNEVLVAGGSSGAQLAALTGLTANEPKYQPGFEHVDTAVRGVVALYGVYGRLSVAGIDPHSDALPARHIHADAPPFLVVHGSADSVLSVEGARHFAAELREVSAEPVVYAELPGAQHFFRHVPLPSVRAALDAVERFAHSTRREQPRPLPPLHRRQ